MSSFSVCWNRVRLECRKNTERTPWAQEAALCERVLLEGKPTLQIVCRIARVFENRIGDPAERDRFGHAAAARLGKLHRLTVTDTGEIERMLAKRVPKPAPRQAVWRRGQTRRLRSPTKLSAMKRCRGPTMPILDHRTAESVAAGGLRPALGRIATTNTESCCTHWARFT
jgi:hypothetical protein